MPFNISSFKSNIENYGVLQNNKFEIYIRPPDILLNSLINDGKSQININDMVRLLKLRAEDVRVPGVSHLTADINRYGVGPTQKFVFNSQLNEISLTFLSDRFGFIWQFWHNWMKLIFDFNGADDSTSGSRNKQPTYTTEYRDNYATEMQIIIYDNVGEDYIKINLHKAFPVAFRDSILDWSDNNELLTINVNISFTEFTVQSSTVETNIDDENVIYFNGYESTTATVTP
jgi:hypothetical protein